MKKRLAYLLLIGGLICPSVYAGEVLNHQQTKVNAEQKKLIEKTGNLQLKGQTYYEALKKIAQVFDVGLAVNSNLIPKGTVTLSLTNADVKEALTQLLDGTGTEAFISPEGNITLRKNSEKPVSKKTNQLSGQIKGVQNEVITGAYVQLTPGNFITVSDEDGRFRLSNVPSGDYTIKVSFIGFKPFVKPISVGSGNREEFEITLQEESITLGDMVVTAQKRSENQKEVPIALTKISSKFIENNVVESLGGMAGFVPGVQVSEQTALFPSFVIRGLTSDELSVNQDNRVSVFQDGISTSKAIGAYAEFFDMDRVEVLKGPQGTLFGRSAQIGAIHMITKRAKNETSGYLNVGTGNYNQFRCDGYFNTPLVKDKLFVRVAAIWNKRDGYIKNLSGGTLMGKNTVAARTSINYLPGENSSFDLIINYGKDNNPGQDFKSGTFAPRGGDTSPYTFADLGMGEELKDKRDVLGFTGHYKLFFNNAFSFTSITGYRTITSSSISDSDGTKAQALDFNVDLNYNQFSQEFRFNYNKNRFSGFGGVNYFHEYGNVTYLLTQDERSVFAMLSPLLVGKIAGFKAIPMIVNGEPNLTLTVNPLTKKAFQTSHTESINDDGARNGSYDAFIDGTYKVTPKFKVTAGARLTLEDQTTFYRVDPSPGTLGSLLKKGVNNIFKPTDGRIEKSKSYSDWIGRFIMQYDFTKESNVYASWSKGRRPNVIQIDANETQYLHAEVVYNYELGFKNLLFNNRLQFNVSGFIYDYNNFQTSSADITGGGLYRVSDSGKATGKGVETEVQFAATKNLTVFANYGFLDARFNDKNSDGETQELAGNTFRLTPKHSGSAGISYQLGLGKKGLLAVNLSATYKSGHYFDDENTPGLHQDGYALLNSSVQYSRNNGKYGIRANMNNITNEHFLIDAGNTGNTFGIPTFVPGAPRFYGVQVYYNF